VDDAKAFGQKSRSASPARAGTGPKNVPNGVFFEPKGPRVFPVAVAVTTGLAVNVEETVAVWE
jgi:hypothetical protein